MVQRATSADRDTALARLGRLARTQLSGAISSEQDCESRQRFRTSLAREASGPSSARWFGFTLAAATAVAGLFFGARAWLGSPLTFEVDSPRVASQGYLQVPDTAPSAHVRFSDGSDLTLEPGTRGRIASLRTDGAVIGLESGKASLHVVHRPETHWAVDAGPFAITVTGTAFDVGWSGADEVFEVTLRTGSILVQGPLATSGIRLTAGERLVANLRAGQLRVEQIDAPAARPPVPAPVNHVESSAAGEVSVRKPEGAPPARSRGSDPKSSWAKRVAAGDFDGVLNEAQDGRLEAVLARSALSDLVALADAARYRGRVELARRALIVQRERFPSSKPARTAAFLLGRLAEADPEAAIAWYDRYLVETPSGEFASEALGRKLVAIQQMSGTRVARPIAEEYLRRFPRGAYAAKARELTSQ